VLTSQGVSFLHAGADFLRTKQGVENSYQSPDSINFIDWSRKAKYKEVHQYYKDLIQLRKNHPAFRMPTTQMIQKHLSFIEMDEENLIAFRISDGANGDSWSEIIVAHNGSKEAKPVKLPDGDWTIVLEDHEIDEAGLRNHDKSSIVVSGISSTILVR
jgi:pullulanase